MYEEFNGPCVVCLEPDEESRRRLVELRELLRRELFDAQPAFVDRYSPTATVLGPSTHSVFHRSSATSSPSSSPYRPLVPIGAFGTVNEAIRMARKLRRLWNPLSFEVTDLQIVSMAASSYPSPAFPRDASGGEWDGSGDGLAPTSPFALSSTARGAPAAPASERGSFVADPPQVGCDAMVMLVGQEVPVDDEDGREMARLICERGEPGGADRRSGSTDRTGESRESWASKAPRNPPRRNLSSNVPDESVNGDEGDACEDLLQFLDEDDVDEGTVVVIGRTHFFTGEMRHYVGMPATSTTEGQASIATTGSSGVTGSTRRKGAVTTARLRDGEFGRVSSVGDDLYDTGAMDMDQ
jgi:hypothetical protein